MGNVERLEKLEQACKLIRDVEFSYPYGDATRAMIYKVMVDKFSFTDIGALMTHLKERIKKDKYE